MNAFGAWRDPVGFPMIWVEEIGAYIHWLPITKIQFEYFVCDAPDRTFDGKWYETVLKMNARITPAKISTSNYWQAFLTGILPAEAERFAFWCGEGFRLPTAKEWRGAYLALNAMPASELAPLELWEEPCDSRFKSPPPRVQELLVQIESAAQGAADLMGYERQLTDQMLMRLGVLEWVLAQEKWGVMGEPFPTFCGNLLEPGRDAPVVTADAEGTRRPYFGFRLLFTPKV